MRKNLFVCLAALSMSLASQSKAGPTAQSIIELLDNEGISLYVTGVANGIQAANQWNAINGDPKIYCANGDIPLGKDLSKSILRLGVSKSGSSDVLVPTAMMIGLQNMFPCR